MSFGIPSRWKTHGSFLMALGLVVAGATPSRAALIHNYSFAQNANDSVGGANGVLVNGATVSNGALQLNAAAQQYVQFNQQLVPTSGSFSISIFAQQATPQAGFVELISQGFSGANGFYIGQGTSGQIRVGDQWQTTGVSFPTDGLRHNYAVTVDAVNNISALYLDGRLVASMNSALTTQGGNFFTRVGRQFDPFGEYFNGRIDNLSIYNNALTAAQVQALNSAVPEPSSLALAASGLAIIAIRGRPLRARPRSGDGKARGR